MCHRSQSFFDPSNVCFIYISHCCIHSQYRLRCQYEAEELQRYMDALRRCYHLLLPIIIDAIESGVVKEDCAMYIEIAIRELLAK